MQIYNIKLQGNLSN